VNCLSAWAWISRDDTSEDGNRYMLVFQDYLTKWWKVFAVKDRTTITVPKCLAEIVWRHGIPAKIIYDRAVEFLSDVLQDTVAILQQLPTSGGHPQTDGLVECFNRTFKMSEKDGCMAVTAAFQLEWIFML